MEGGWHLVSKRDAQHVTLTPVEEVEVEVIEELGRVEDALGLRRDVPPVPLGRQAGRAVVPVHGAQLIHLSVRGRRRLRREGEDLARRLAAEERARQLLSVRELLDVLTRWRGVRIDGVLCTVRDLKVRGVSGSGDEAVSVDTLRLPRGGARWRRAHAPPRRRRRGEVLLH